jgi:hypothetical protein
MFEFLMIKFGYSIKIQSLSSKISCWIRVAKMIENSITLRINDRYLLLTFVIG